ncbi:MAG: hypothetical protein KAG26_05110, partial [Methylococcales bacterium]|nr:hypothetical protein [Methylococcales bacterium]
MPITQEIAAKHYELAHDQLMSIAENYQSSDEAVAIALTAAQTLSINYIDYSIEIITDLNQHYNAFVESLEKTLTRLEKTTLDQIVLAPLKSCFKTAKAQADEKISKPADSMGWSDKLDLLFKWVRTRMGWQ